MRVGVIRGDVPSPIFLADLEPISQTNFPTEPVGQSRYVSRPNTTSLTNYLAGVYASDTQDGAPAVTLPIPAGQPGAGGIPAGIQGASAVTFPLTISGSNDTIRVQLVSAGPFTAVAIAHAAYATMTLLLVAVNTALAGHGATATTDTATGTLFVLQSTAVGVGAYIGVDTVGNGSNFNTPAHLSDGQNFTMPSAATIITATNPVVVPPATGSINVSAATLLSTVGAAPTAAGIANLIAPQFQETQVAVQSFQVGNLSRFLELAWNPNSRALPVITSGPAIQVVQNDGHTSFASAAIAALPMITGAVHNSPNTGDITISGQGLGNVEYPNDTVVVVRAAAAAATPGSGVIPYVRLTQKRIVNTLSGGTQGSVSNTSIVIPASLLTPVGGPALGIVGSNVEVKYESFANTNYGTAASVASWAANVSTLTGLTNQFASQVGAYITMSGAASAGNNGTFRILSVVSATSITVSNINGVGSDGNNGALVWSETAPIAFVVT